MPTPAAMPPQPYDYDLPPELIAQVPAPHRTDSQLLCVDPASGRIDQHAFHELPSLLRGGDLLVLNDSRVFPARLWTRRVETGGRVELLLVRPEPSRDRCVWLALARPVRRLRAGDRLILTDLSGSELAGPELTVLAMTADGYILVTAAQDLAAVAAAWGDVPLPPYIKRRAEDPDLDRRREQDRRRYQTVYARQPGSVAAPTAGLHFDQELLQELQDKNIATAWVTLHIGPGTFRPPTAAQVAAKRLHAEAFFFPSATDAAIRRARERRGRIVAVGTTSLRVLETVRHLLAEESAAESLTATQVSDSEWHWQARAEGTRPLFEGTARRRTTGWEVAGSTRLFIRPPDTIQAADGLLTNFHLPGSSLLMLVAALAPAPLWRRAYEHAVQQQFRFYSYGDAMLILASRETERNVV